MILGNSVFNGGMCLGNSVFNGVLGVSITATKFAPEVVKFCCDCVCAENSVSEVMGYQLARLLHGFWFLVCYATTQLANQLQQTRIQVVRSNAE